MWYVHTQTYIVQIIFTVLMIAEIFQTTRRNFEVLGFFSLRSFEQTLVRNC